MSTYDWLQIFLVLLSVTILTPPLGKFIAGVMEGERNFLSPIFLPVEGFFYRIIGVKETDEMNWRHYLKAVLSFSVLSIFVLLLLQLFQGRLPFNPQALPSPSWHSALNTAISFVTNTNWQSYSGENTMSYFTQMAGLAVQNFLSAAAGIAVAVAFIRGLRNKSTQNLGNFWLDMTRAILYILIPLSFALALVLVSQGVVQSFSHYTDVTTLEGAKQLIPQGPAASQIAIKQLGTNGGGFFNANSAHPFENPTPFTNFLELIALILIPSALTYTFGLMVKNRRQGWIIWAVMMIVLCGGLGVSLWSEYSTTPIFGQAALMEGKEVRFGVTNSILWSALTTAASNGSVNAMHSSLSPLSGGVAMLNIMLGEIVFGGVGSGLYGMLLFVILTVFLSGLMVGRTPEYLGKKIEARDIQMTIIGILSPSAVILIGAGISVVLPNALSSLANKGPHGLSEILYAFTSAAGNNGSAFGGLNANTIFYNIGLGLAMLVGRFAVIAPVLAIAGNISTKKISPPSIGTFSTDNLLFGVLLTAVILIVGALTFFPVLSLGPIAEHLLMLQGRTF